MVGRYSRLVALFILLLFIPALSCAEDEQLGNSAALDRGLINNEPYSFAMMIKAKEVPRQERTDLLKKALAESPDLPGMYFRLSRAVFPDVIKGASYYIEGIEAYKRNAWWLLSLSGLVIISAMGALVISVSILAFIRFFIDIPLIVHEMNENRKLIIVAFLIMLSALAGPLYIIAGMLVLGGIHMKKSGKFLVFVVLVLITCLPFLTRVIDTFLSSSTPFKRAVIGVHAGTDNSYAIDTLKSREDFLSKFTYALALKREGRVESAINLYTEILEKNPEARVYLNLGNAYFALGNGEQAKEMYKKALSIDKTAMVLYNLAQVNRDMLDFKSGDKYYDEAANLNRDEVSRFMVTASTNPNRFVVDSKMNLADIWNFLYRNSVNVAKVYNFNEPVSIAVGAVLLVLFIILSAKSKNRAIRCSDCGKVICPLCAEVRQWGNRCEACFKLQKQDTSPQAKVRRMLAANQQRNRLRGIMRMISFLPPGIPQIYSGLVFSGMFFMWSFLFCILTIVLNPLFSTGIGSFTHWWLFIPMGVGIVTLYLLSFLSFNRRIESGWL